MLDIDTIEILLIAAAFVVLISRKVKLPYTVGLVLGGAILAAVGVLNNVTLTKELIFQVLLPPLIFEGAFFLRWKDLRKNLAPVLVLAVFGVVIGAGVTAGIMTQFGHWTFPAALVFGALIAATDPVSVIALFRELKVEGRLRLLVEAESLFNDGAAAVVFGVAILIAQGAVPTVGMVSTALIEEIGGGLLVGAVAAAGAVFFARKAKDHLVQITFTAAAALGSFLLADYLHFSGVLAVLVCGLIIGNYGEFGTSDEEARAAVGAFWEFAAFLANAIIFLLIGVQEHELWADISKNLVLIGLAIAAVLAGRFVSVYSLSAIFCRSRHKIDLRHQHVLVWGGLRGAMALALAISLPDGFPFREEVVTVTFAVVACSLLVQGMTVSGLMRWLKLTPSPDQLPSEA